MSDASAIVRRLGQLKTQRAPHEQVWRECFDYTYPLRGSGLNQDAIDAERGQSKQADILDSTGTDAAQLLASEIASGTTPANTLWFEYAVTGSSDDDAETRWFGDAAKTVWENIHASNYDSERLDAVMDAICGGWMVLYIDEDREAGGFAFERWPLAECYVAASKPGGLPDTVFREYTLTAEQAVAVFGEAMVSEQTRKLATDKPDEVVKFVHSIQPRKSPTPGAKLARNLPVESCHVEVANQHTVRESGYHEMPVIVARWQRLPNSAYGVGQVYSALPDIKMLQSMWRLDLGAGELAVSGMWIAEDDGVLNPRTLKIGPRKVIVANSVDSMKPLQSGSNFQYSSDRIDRLQAKIRRTMLADQLPPADGPTKTAYEYSVRLAVLRKILGPIFGRLQSEELGPTALRCFGLAYRAGILGQAPASLGNRDFHVRYVGPLARAQRLEEVAAVERVVEDAKAMAEVWPGAVDVIDADEAMRVVGAGSGIPAKVLRDVESLKALRDARAEQQAKEAQQAQAQELQSMAAQSAMSRAAA